MVIQISVIKVLRKVLLICELVDFEINYHNFLCQSRSRSDRPEPRRGEEGVGAGGGGAPSRRGGLGGLPQEIFLNDIENMPFPAF